jgi:hypothetical protein
MTLFHLDNKVFVARGARLPGFGSCFCHFEHVTKHFHAWEIGGN